MTQTVCLTRAFLSSLLLSAMFGWLAPLIAFAQTDSCKTIGEDEGYMLRTIKVEGRWTPSLKQLDLSEFIGKPYSGAIDSKAQEKVSNYLAREENATIERGIVRGMGSLLLVTSCAKVDRPARQVDLLIRPFYLRIDSYNIGQNLLFVPRSSLPTFYDHAPRPLLAFNPKFGIEQDRTFGPAATLNLKTDLLNLPRLLQGETLSTDAPRLEVKAAGRKSLDEPFYQSGLELALSNFESNETVQQLSVSGAFVAERLPLGKGERTRNAGEFGGAIRFKPRLGCRLVDNLSLGGKYRWSKNKSFAEPGKLTESATEHAFAARFLSDGRLGDGFLRAGVWLEAAAPKGSVGATDSYQRLAYLIGYAAELGRSNQTVGVEALVGGGHTWGKAPEYARFYGGNSARNFIYESFDAPISTAFPAGPLLRSFGEAQATQQTGTGGESYWHINLNLTAPIPGWSRSLIPDVSFTNSDGEQTTLKGKLKRVSLNSSRSFIFLELSKQFFEELKKQNPTMPEDELRAQAEELAMKRTEEIVKRDYEPPIKFIADKANLFAVKPLFMFDVGRINSRVNPEPRTRFALGGGIQFTLIVAKFELGYLRTLRRLPGDNRGNLIARLVFQNFF
jgi:hypothetical protein